MFRRGHLYAAIILLLISGAPSFQIPCARITADPARWVGTSVDELVRASHSAYKDEDAYDTYEDVIGALSRAVRGCGLAEDAEFAESYRNFLDYVDEASLAVEPHHELGFNVPDAQYFAETIQYLGVPDFLLDQQFLRDVSRHETLPSAKAYLRALNEVRGPDDQLIFFSYTSRHLGTPDNNDSYRRLLVVVRGDAELGEPDKWVQFGVTDPGVRTKTRNVSVVSALLVGDGTYNAYFKDYYRTYKRDGSISIKGRLELGHGDENCASCHKSGVLPIFPKAGSVGAGEEALVDIVNERFRSYGSPRFGGYLDTTKLGPGLSLANDEERRMRFGDRFSNGPVANAMECGRCHTPETLGYLNWPMDRIIIDSFIKGGEMPRGHELDAVSRKQLYDKLIDEYFAISHERPGIFKAWLLGRNSANN